MQNQLIKNTLITYTPGSPGVPSRPGTPPTPARTYTAYETVCAFYPAESGGTAGRYELFDGTPVIFECRSVPYLVRVPASPGTPPTPGTPATPASTIVGYNLGWNSGAKSVGSFGLDGYISFKADTPIGAVVGLAVSDPDAGYRNITHGFYLTHGIARIYELGVEAHYIGAYTAGATFRIDRAGSVVTYKIGGTTVYTSSMPSRGTVFIDASFFSGNDYVYDPVIAAVSTPSGANNTLPGLRTFATDKTYCASATELPKLSVTSSAKGHGVSAPALPGLRTLASNKPYGAATGSFPALYATAEGGLPAPPYAFCEGAIGGLATASTGLTGEVGQVSTALYALRSMSSEHVYGEAKAVLPAMRALCYGIEGNGNAMMGERIGATITTMPEYTVVAVMDIHGGIQAVFGVSPLSDASMPSAAGLLDTYSATALADALMRSYAHAQSEIPPWEQSGEVWVLNYDTSASSSYENFDFNSFAQVGSRYFGAKSDGIYLLEGDTDAGAPIHASISLGKSGMGSRVQKRVTECYLGASSSGTLYLKVMADGASYVYEARNASAQLRAQQVKLGKGLQANYFTFEIYNHDGCDFELNDVEFRVVDLQRRIK